MRPVIDGQLAGLRIGAYARFSSDKQSETSASAQIARLQQWVQASGCQLCLQHTYRDEGMSGATNQRPGLISLMAAVDSGELDVVVVEDLSRLSRDIEHSASMRKRFAFSGVRLIGIADGIDTLGNGGDLLYGVKSILSEQYLKDLGDKTSRGLRDRAQVGRVTGALPYGYASAASPDGQGKVAVIEAAQAAVVQRIFRMRAAGRSYRDIAKTLNDEGVEPPRGRQKDSRKRRSGWAMSGVRSMLHNSKYAGRWTFGARTWKKSPTTGRASCGRPSLRLSRWRCPSSASWTKRPGLGCKPSTRKLGSGTPPWDLRRTPAKAERAPRGGSTRPPFAAAFAAVRWSSRRRKSPATDVMRAAATAAVARTRAP